MEQNEGAPWEIDIGAEDSPYQLFITVDLQQSQIGRMQNDLIIIENSINDEVATLAEVGDFLKQLDAPFGFIDQTVSKTRAEMGDNFVEEDHRYFK